MRPTTHPDRRLSACTRIGKVHIVRAALTCELDQSVYPSGIKVSKKEMEEINLRRDAFHGEWNYTISPRSQKWVSIPSAIVW